MKPRAVMKNELIADIANAWRNARTVVVFTGAGMSNQQLTLRYAWSAFFNFEITLINYGLAKCFIIIIKVWSTFLKA